MNTKYDLGMMVLAERDEVARLQELNAELSNDLQSVLNALDNGGLKRPSDWAKRLRRTIEKATGA